MKRPKIIGLLAVLALVVAACGDGSPDTAPEEEPAAPDAAEDTADDPTDPPAEGEDDLAQCGESRQDGSLRMPWLIGRMRRIPALGRRVDGQQCRLRPEQVAVHTHRSVVPVDLRCSQACTTRAAMAASATFMYERGS
jgi:hypothetical protein